MAKPVHLRRHTNNHCFRPIFAVDQLGLPATTGHFVSDEDVSTAHRLTSRPVLRRLHGQIVGGEKLPQCTSNQ
jgi:hypothetical protein